MTHPNPAFAWNDAPAMQAFAAEVAFAQIAAVVDDAPMLAHAPVLVGADGSVRFHLARSNAITRHLDGRPIALGIVADDVYVSPDWYGLEHQVPTWNYRLVEVHGVARQLPAEELPALLDDLSVVHERKLLPKPIWRLAKLPPRRADAMFQAIDGFAIDAPTWRGTLKLGQNKPAAARAGVARALAERGQARAAMLMEEPA